MSKHSRISGPVSFQPQSANKKLSHVDEKPIKNSNFVRQTPRAPYCCSTYVSIEATCPDSCRFKGCGCYIQAGLTQRAAKILDQNAEHLSGDEVIREEVRLIDRMFLDGVPSDGARGGRDLRLHIGGDTSSAQATQWLAGAADRWRARGGGAVWAYTHRWREVPITCWGQINIFASVETLDEAAEAMRRRYPVAMTVLEFVQSNAYMVGSPPLKIYPCPAQTSKAVCIECRLCLGHLKKKVAVGFSLHGAQVSMARKQISDLRQLSLKAII